MSAVTCERRLPGRGRTCRKVMRVTTDQFGRVHYHCQHCAWQYAGRCWQCGVVRNNDLKHGVYCDACRLDRRRKSSLSCLADPGVRNRKNAQTRRRWRTDPAMRARKRAARAAWAQANPDKVRRHKRNEALKQSPARRARERAWNQDPERAAKKRAQARESYYRQHPNRPSPVCKSCGVAIVFVSPGRPKTKCDTCVPPSTRKKRKVPSQPLVAA